MAFPPPAISSLAELLFENNHTLVAFLDLEYNFIRVSESYAVTDKKEPAFFTGKNYFSLYPNEENLQIFNDVVTTGKPYTTKTRFFEYTDTLEKEGTCWDWSLTRVNDDQGQAIGVLLQLIDITRHITVEKKLYDKVKKELGHYDKELETIIEARTKSLQEAVKSLEHENNERIKTEALLLKAKQEAEIANVSKSQFLSRMSHELRTPMNAILGFSQLLTLNGLDDKQLLYNEEILLAGKHLLSMISDILDLSRIEEGDFSILTTNVLLYQLVDESISLVKHKLNFRNITIHNLIDENDPLTLQADETRLKEVLVNLLTNAVKYNNDNGLVSIGYKILNDKYARLYISDTGKGLSKEEQQHIFEPFNRLGAEYTDIEGVGIGLTIAKKLIELMNGSISIESDKGKGSTFYLDCCIGDKLSSYVTEKSSVNLIAKDRVHNILYVEDNISNQKIIENLFREYPEYNLTVAASAEEGLMEAEINLFDLIILDINLPGMDGYDALDELNLNARTKNIPVIALSASASTDHIKKGLEAGFKQYITKPFLLPDFISIINSELNVSAKH